MEELIGVYFSVACLLGLYLGFSIGDTVKNTIKKITAKEPDVAYIYRNLDALIAIKLDNVREELRLRKKTLTDKEATELAMSISNEIYNALSDNFLDYANNSITDNEVLNYITSFVTRNILRIMSDTLPNAFSVNNIKK